MAGDEFIPNEYLFYIQMFICIPGAIGNILSVIALRQNNMRSPTNSLLSYRIANDTFALTTAVICLIIDRSLPSCRSKSFHVFREAVCLCSGLSFALNSWLMSGVAIFRYFIVSNGNQKKYFTYKTAKITVLICFVMVNIEVLTYHLRLNVAAKDNTTCYITKFHDTYVTHDVNQWSDFCFSLFTLLIMVVFSILLVSTLGFLRMTRLRRVSLDVTLNNKRWIRTRNVTLSLIGMVIFSALAEIPFVGLPIYQSITGSRSHGPWWEVDTLNDVYEIGTRLNCASSILFLSITGTFRKTLSEALPHYCTCSVFQKRSRTGCLGAATTAETKAATAGPSTAAIKSATSSTEPTAEPSTSSIAEPSTSSIAEPSTSSIAVPPTTSIAGPSTASIAATKTEPIRRSTVQFKTTTSEPKVSILPVKSSPPKSILSRKHTMSVGAAPSSTVDIVHSGTVGEKNTQTRPSSMLHQQ